MIDRICTPAQQELARSLADSFAGTSHPGRYYSERRSPTGWSAQLTYDPPCGAKETDGEQFVRSISGNAMHLRNVRRVPDEARGMGIDAIRDVLFASA